MTLAKTLCLPLVITVMVHSKTAAADSDLTGYFKSFAVFQDSTNLGTFKLDKAAQSQNSLRLMWDKAFGDTVWQIHYELSPVFSSEHQNSSTFSVTSDSYRLANLATSFTNKADQQQVFQNLDRFNVQWRLADGDLTIGRQAISFGSARVINPTDIFLPFDVRTFNQEYRVGVDAIRYQKPLGDLGEADFGLVLGDGAKTENSALYLQLRGNIEGKDLQFSINRFAQQTMIGAGIQTSIQDFGFWFEIAGVQGDVDYVRSSIGLDYAFTENAYGMIEYHFNGAGESDASQYLPLFASVPYQKGGIFLLGEHYLIPAFNLQLSPLYSLTIQAIYNLSDQSAFVSSALEYNMTTDVYLDLGYYHFIGDGANVTAANNFQLDSEYGVNPDVIYASIKYYF